MRAWRLMAWLMTVPIVAACAGDSAATQGTEGQPEGAAADTTLPAAIRGQAGPPRGENVSYFADDPASIGYVAGPEGEGPFPAIILIHEWNGLV